MKTYRLHRVGLFSLLQFGCLLGFVLSFLPIALLSFLFIRLMSLLANWLGGLVYRIPLPILGDFDINVVELLNLTNFYDWANSWSALEILEILAIVLLLSAAAAIIIGFLTFLGGLIFNLFCAIIGGLKITLSEESVVPLKEAVGNTPPGVTYQR